MSSPPPDLASLVSFPSRFVFRVMGESGRDLPQACEQAVAAALSRPCDEVQVQPSAKGRFLAVRLAVEVRSPEDILDVYARLRQVEGVRLVL